MEFSELEAEHSIILDKNKKGFNDAVPLMRIHPLIRKILKVFRDWELLMNQ